MTMGKWSLMFKSSRVIQVILVASCGEHILRSMAEHPAVRTSKCVGEPVLSRTRLEESIKSSIVRPRMTPTQRGCTLKSPINMIGSGSDEMRL
nr:unnamed protein product [Callosobruchus analis]